MSDTNPNVSEPSQESASDVVSSADKSDLTTSVNGSEKLGSGKSPTSKIAKPTGLKLSTSTSASTTKIGRLCNNIQKPAIPPNPALHYSSSLRHTYTKSLTNVYSGWSNGSYRETYADRVSLRDIGIRLPVVHFSLDYDPLRSRTGTTGGVEGAGTMSTSSMRRTSDEITRRRLADVSETDENAVPYYGNGNWSYDRKMSSGSVLSDSSRKSDEFRRKRSSDASSPSDFYSDYWRSEMEPRRASDASVVLTEDTDQFIIGDRVWVGGVKPGQIAYIGETQFAPGEWAGVVLDEPIGKNDGTVANIRYFQCEPKKGIFSRLTRLTRYPLIEGGAGEPAAPRPPSTEGQRKSNGSLLASVPKKSSLVLAAPKTSPAKSPSITPDTTVPNVQVGDRVIVKSSRGSKAGILRYLGTTDFAAGEWCGVELDDPLGKNDGSVSGTRYFECRPNFGLFAPLHKVSKSPASKRPSQGNCVIHNKTGTAAPGVRRQGSKESLVSLSSTASTAASVRSATRKIGVRTPTTPTSAKNALQETLKEKELHIEQLLKERDLERAEVTRAASQADEAERRLVAFRQEFEQQKEEAEARLSDLDAMVCLLKSENEELKNLLDDERKKYEDLQFRFEEEMIDKADLKSTSVKYEEKVNLLEKTLSEERKRTEALEQDSNKLFEAEEQMVILRDELDSSKEEISELKKLRSGLEQEHISLEAHLTSARAEIESLKIENESLKSSSSQEQAKLRETQEKTFQAFEECKKEFERKQKETEELSKEVEAKEGRFLEKEKEIHSKYLKIMNDLTEKHQTESGNLAKQLEDLRNSSETKLKLLENQLEEKMRLCNSLETQLNDTNVLLSKTTAERSVELTNQKEIQETLQNQLKQTAEEIVKQKEQLVEEKAKSETLLRERQKLEEEVAEIRKSLTNANQSADKQLVSLKEVIEKQKVEMEKMKAETECVSREYKSLKETQATDKQKEEERLREIDRQMVGKDQEVEKLKEQMAKQKEDFDAKNREIKQLYESNEESFRTKIKQLETAEGDRRKEIETLSRDLESAKQTLEARESQIREEQTNCKNLTAKLSQLEESYKKTVEEKDRIQLEAGDAMRKVQSLEDKLTQMTSQKAKLEADISNFINTSNDSSVQLAKLNEDLRSKEKEMDALREDASQKIGNFERAEQALKQNLEKQESEVKAAKEELERVKKDHSQEVEVLKNKLEASVVSQSTNELEWKKKMEVLKGDSDSSVRSLEETIRLMEKKEIESRTGHEEEVRRLMNAQEELKVKLRETETAAAARETSLGKKIEELNTERDNLRKAIEEGKTEFLTSEKQMLEKMKQDAEMFASESEKLRNELKETTDKLATTVQELTKEKEEKNRLNEEKSKLEKVTSTMEELVKELQTKNRELELSASSVESENKVLKDTINQLREEKCSLDKETTEKMMQVTELRSQLEALEYSKKNREAVDEVKIRNLEEEISELKAKFLKSETVHSGEVSEKAKQIAELKNEIGRLKEECGAVMSGKEKDIENVNAVVAQLRKELEDRLFESERKNEQIGKMEKKLQQTKEELEAEKKKSEEYGNRLNASETERIDLKERFEEQAKLLVNGAELGSKLEEVSRKLSEAEKKEQETANNAKLEKETLEKMLETTNSLLNQRENEAKALAKEMEAVRQEKANLVNNNKTLVEALQKEKAALQKELEETKKTAGKVEANSNAPDGDGGELQEEREFQKGQVDFLNSVIVDMQKKNDALKARIEILEMGFSPEDVDEFNLSGITTRSVAPRLFCDICDRFDLHDTEDCPTQASEDVPPPKSSKVRVVPPERPYCEICEVFGHDAADCDDAETF